MSSTFDQDPTLQRHESFLHGDRLREDTLYDFARYVHIAELALNIYPAVREYEEAVHLKEVLDLIPHTEITESHVRKTFTDSVQNRVVKKSPHAHLLSDETDFTDQFGATVTLFEMGQERILDELSRRSDIINSHATPHRKLGFLKRLGVRWRAEDLQKYEDEHDLKEAQRKSTLRKNLLQMTDTLLELIEDPGQALARNIAEENIIKAGLQASKKEQDARLSEATLSESRAERMASYVVSKTETSDTKDETPTISTPEQAENLRSAVEDESVEGFMHFDFPWMGDHNKYKATRYEDLNEIFVVRALEPKLAALAATLETGARKNKDGRTAFQTAIHEHAKRMSQGIMPFENANGVIEIRIKDSEKRAPYKGYKFWFNRGDVGANVERIYFTLKPLEGVSERGNKRFLMVVAGITDQQNQEAFFQAVSTLSHKRLRNLGVGAV